MGHANIKNMLLEMKFLGMLHSFEASLAEATKEGWAPSEFLDHLLQAESDWRVERKTQGLIKIARLSQKPNMEDFDFVAKRNISKPQIKELYKLKWLEQGRPVIIVGPTGVGKTFLAQALGYHACLNKKTVLFMTISNFLENQMLARSSGTYLKFRDKLAKPELLILDDFGLRKFSTQEAHDLNDLIKERIGAKSLMLTTQLPIKNWVEVIEDPVVADTIIDQLKHPAIEILLKGESYRGVKAKKLEPLIDTSAESK